jgi:hypothetical protein
MEDLRDVKYVFIPKFYLAILVREIIVSNFLLTIITLLPTILGTYVPSRYSRK